MPIKQRGFRVRTGKRTYANYSKHGQLTSTSVKAGRTTHTIKGGKMTSTTSLGYGRSYVTTGDAPSVVAGLVGLVIAGVIIIGFFLFFH